MTRKFFMRALAQLLLPLTVPVLILAWLSVSVYHSYLTDELNRRHRVELSEYGRSVFAVMRELEQLNLQLSNNPSVTFRLKSIMSHAEEGFSFDQYKELTSIVDMLFASPIANEYIQSMYLYYDAGGRFFLNSDSRISTLDSAQDRGWYDSYLKAPPGASLWTQVRSLNSGPGTHRQVLSVYQRLNIHNRDASHGVLVMNIDMNRILRLMDSLDASDQSCLCVLDDSGNLLFSNSLFQSRFGEAESRQLTSAVQTLPDGSSVRQMLAGKPYVLQVQGVDAYSWRICRAIEAALLYAVPNRLTRITIAAILLVVLICTGIAYSIARGNARDIQHIVDSIEKVQSGETLELSGIKSPEVYSYILQNVIDTFLQKNYLSLQLAQKTAEGKMLELMAMQAQLNPHFLFNTLETIQWKAIGLTGAPNEASLMIENLSEILHYALDTSSDMVSIREEIDMTNAYLSIQRIRYSRQFDFDLNCPDDLLDVPVMKLILQPLLENSIYHGIKHKTTPSLITIDISRERDLMKIQVADDGVGMTPERLQEIRDSLNASRTEESHHIGLYNTNKRIRLIYGEAYGLSINSAPSVGTTVTLLLPVSPQR